MKSYYYTQLSPMEQSCYHKILDAIRSGHTTVRFIPPARLDVGKIRTAIDYDHAELFYVDFDSFRVFRRLDGSVTKVTCRYRMSSSEKTALDQTIAAIIQQAPPLPDDLAKCRWAHDYLLRHVRYHYDAIGHYDQFPDAYSVRGALCGGRAVCNGIAKAFQLLCHQLDVSAVFVSGTSTNPDLPGAHAWNIVWIDGQPAHVDVTWDICQSVARRHTDYDYFCIPDADIRCDHSFDGTPPCSTDAFSFFRQCRRVFSDTRQLKSYLKSAFQKDGAVFYFKMILPHSSEDVFQQILDDACKIIWKRSRNTGHIRTSCNREQRCFFIRFSPTPFPPFSSSPLR